MPEAADFFPRFHFPKSDCLIFAGRRHQVSIWTECHRRHDLLVALECGSLPGSGNVPQFHGSIVASRNQQPPIRTESNRPYQPLMPLEGGLLLDFQEPQRFPVSVRQTDPPKQENRHKNRAVPHGHEPLLGGNRFSLPHQNADNEGSWRLWLSTSSFSRRSSRRRLRQQRLTPDDNCRPKIYRHTPGPRYDGIEIDAGTDAQARARLVRLAEIVSRGTTADGNADFSPGANRRHRLERRPSL